MRIKKNKAIGFTLVEMLVVVSIIGLLLTFAAITFDNARKKSRDAKRLSDIAQLQKALDLYYNKYGAYPISGNCNATVHNAGWCNSIQSVLNGHWVRNGDTVNLGEFLNGDPIDPRLQELVFPPLDGRGYYYFSLGYGGSGQWYMIVFGLEDHSHPLQDSDGVKTCDGTALDYGASLGGNNGLITIGRGCQL